MSTDKEAFLSRWSRLKRKAATEKTVAPAKPAAPATPAENLPPVESLNFESDFAAFLRANVEESVKRAALKKLLHDPRFNVMDGLDVYIDDYTKNDPIPEEMLKTLEHARSTLFGPQPEEGEPTQTAQAEEEENHTPKGKEEGPEAPDDGHPRQDA